MIAVEAYADDASISLEEDTKVEGTIERVLHIGLLCNDFKVTVGNNFMSGNIIEVGLVKLGLAHSMIKTRYDQEQKRVLYIPYDSERKIMTTINKIDDKYRANCKRLRRYSFKSLHSYHEKRCRETNYK